MIVSITRVRDDLTPSLKNLERGLIGNGNRALLRTATQEFWNITRESFGANKPNRPDIWPGLAASTIKRYKNKYYGGNLTVPTLLRSGLLLNSIRMEVNASYGRVWQDDTQCVYGVIHQFGDISKGIPARPYFPIVGDDHLTTYAFNRINQALEMKLREMIRSGIS